ncbi:FAD-binding oxidoreductase [Cupriavidus sp. L7L]|uniref:NAD(P)/FAD-dependent oxidoreductase n=1 Tax=Cupriavidus sp. L7L TaxID=2546443 RepID=UPI00105539D0|nr:FAD-binding oxidoreductase [Cupriavidus sp. L7L]TDF62660.1 FAD-binding oxidoreductase [Cupriavidus sp. L7L]
MNAPLSPEKLLPADDKTNGWSAILPKRLPRPSVPKSASFDWLVIGAGYAGMSAARRLAILNPSQSIALLEAQQVGEGAHGRNAGFAIDLPHNNDHDPANTEKGHRHIRLSRYGIDCLDDLVSTHAIECQWSRSGRYDCAVSPEISRKLLGATVAELEALGEPYQIFRGEALHERLGTRYYDSAIHTPGTRLLNPAALSRGLADTLPPNVKLFENSPVLELDSNSMVVATLPGEVKVSARKAVLTNNAFISRFGCFKRQLLPFVLFASLSRPLNPDERKHLGGTNDWGITPAHGIAGATLRYTQDYRILFRYGFQFAPSLRCSDSLRERMKRSHEVLFRARFPMLDRVTLDHFWAGYLSLSQNGAPGWGQLSNNVYAAVNCNGVGIAKQTTAGALIAEFACDTGHPLIGDMMALGSPDMLPRRPFLDVGVRAYLAAQKWAGRSEK